jgi:hypothetical protein
MRIRWSDNDRYFGPFTYAPDSRGYRPLALTIDSGDDDDYPGCRLRLSGFGHTLLLAIPAVIKPWAQWVEVRTEPTRSQMIAAGRKPGYSDTHRRQYGFSYSEGFLQVFLGAQTHDSSTTQDWSKHLPWTQWRFAGHRLYGLDGEIFAALPHRARFRTPEYEESERLTDACPTASFSFNDFDGETISATTKIEEREWHFGEGWFKWLSIFRRPKIRRSLDLRFSAETGKRKGSWKGGTIGHSIDMLPANCTKLLSADTAQSTR